MINLHEWMNEWMKEGMKEWMNEWMKMNDGWVNEWKKGVTDVNKFNFPKQRD